MNPTIASLLDPAGIEAEAQRTVSCSPTGSESISTSALDQLIKAVLYEGYILYPYRASSQKNQRERFTFGRVYPKVYCDSQNGAEPCSIQSECLLQVGNAKATLEITLGFLQPMRRHVGRLKRPTAQPTGDDAAHISIVPQFEANGKIYQAWTEAVERKIPVTLEVRPQTKAVPFTFAASRELETIADKNAQTAGAILRQLEHLDGLFTIELEDLGNGLHKVSAQVTNESPVIAEALGDAERILCSTFASAHIVFRAEQGEFISLLETPPEFEKAAAACKNTGVWPVLAGDDAAADRSTMLASPIILYDYPKVSPTSTGDFFDGTEIDEMLTLRVLTMTDAEKREMQVDDFSRRILERTHGLDAEGLLKLHGGMRTVESSPPEIVTEDFFNPAQPVTSAVVDGVALQTGDCVVIRPKRRADAMDWILAGKTAVIEALEQDAEGNVHFALVLEDDPGIDLGLARQSGHRFFYRADEVSPLKRKTTT